MKPDSDQDEKRGFLLEMLPKQSIGAEIGVHLGKFSARIIDIVSPKELHLIDPWEFQPSSAYKTAWYGGRAEGGQAEMDGRYQKVCTKFESNIKAKQVHIHRGYSEQMLEQFPDEYFDWIYIDGNHLYEYVKVDLEISLKKVKKGGYITGDDYGMGGWWKGGVKKAVDEFVDHQAVELVAKKNGQFVIKK